MELTVLNSTETEKIAKKIGEAAHAGDIILMSGDLGAGKTTMTKGIAQGLGIQQMIKSPTYTIVREYQSGRLPLYHMDVYRVGGETEELGLEEYFEGDGLSVVEWGTLLEEDTPDHYLAIHINKDKQAAEKRQLSIKGVGAAGEAFLKRIDEKLQEDCV